MSLVLAVIAAFVIILAGFLSEVRIGTMLLRGLLGFVVAGIVGALFVTAFETSNLDVSEGLSQDRDEGEVSYYAPPDEEEASMGEEPVEEATGFRPLAEQDLEHMRPPE